MIWPISIYTDLRDKCDHLESRLRTVTEQRDAAEEKIYDLKFQLVTAKFGDAITTGEWEEKMRLHD